MTNQIWVTKDYEPINNKLLSELQKTLENNKMAYYILPNSWLIKHAQKRFFDLGGSITFQGGIISLNALVKSILKQANITGRFIDKASSLVLVANILLTLLAENKLKYFNNFNNIEDMAPSVLNIIKEIKHYYNDHESEIAELEQLPLKYHDIMLIYDRYYTELDLNNLLDFEQAISKAIEVCNSGLGCLKGELLIVAGLSFNKLQLDLIEALTKTFNRVVILLQTNTNNLFNRELGLVNYFVNKGFKEFSMETYKKNTISNLIFTGQKIPAKQNITVQGYHSKRLEVKETIRSIKRLLLKKDITTNDIAIVAQNTAEYSNLLKYYAAKAGVNLKVFSSENILQSMPVKMALQLLKVELSNWSADEFLNFLTESYQWPSSVNASLIADFIRITPCSGSLYTWINSCKRLQNLFVINQKVDIENQSSSLSYQQLKEVEKGLLYFNDLWKALPQKGNYEDWIESLFRLIKEFGIGDTLNNYMKSIKNSEANRLYRVWSLFIKTLKQQAQFSNLWPQNINLKTFYIILKDILKAQNLVDESIVNDCVHVYSPLQIAGTSYRFLFILGFNEGKWPSSSKGSWLHSINDEDMRLPLQAIKDHRVSEKLNFIRTLAVADNMIHLSYTLRDNQDKELLPSQYLAELTSINNVIIKTNSPSLFPECLNDAFCNSELLAIKVLINKQAEQNDIDSRITVENLRFNDESSIFNGVMNDIAIKDKLEKHYGNDAIYSTTMLEQYGKCAFAFFMQRVLQVKPLDQLSIDINPLIRGNIIHSVLANFLEQYKENRLLKENTSEYEQRLTDLLNKKISEIKSEVTNEGEVWVNIESDRILYILRIWLQNEIELQRKTNFRPNDFEYSFNKLSELQIIKDTRVMRIEGFIDRIDINDSNIIVYDYKSGIAPKLKDIRDGVAFQIPFYSLAAQKKYPTKKVIGGGYYRIGGDFNRKSGMWHEDYLEHIDLSSRISDKVNAEEWSELIDKVKNKALEYQQNITNGYFKLSPRRPCPNYCAYKNICRITPLLRAITEAKNNEIH